MTLIELITSLDLMLQAIKKKSFESNNKQPTIMLRTILYCAINIVIFLRVCFVVLFLMDVILMFLGVGHM